MNVIYEDKEMIIVEKAAGQLTQSGKSFDLDLTSEVLAYRKQKGEDVYAAVINRLDRPVSGLVVYAKNAKKAAQLSIQMQNKEFGKQYYAIVCGKIMDRSATLVDYLVTDKAKNISAVVSKDVKGAKRAELKYELLKDISIEEASYSLIKIDLITGRHHQIRVQFASRNMPIAGDMKYGRADAKDREHLGIGKQEIALCAYALCVDKKTYTIKPSWLGQL